MTIHIYEVRAKDERGYDEVQAAVVIAKGPHAARSLLRDYTNDTRWMLADWATCTGLGVHDG